MWYNPFIITVLRSPVHFLASGMYMLVSFTGRKSGRRYVTPVQYRQRGSTLTFVTRRSRVWWRNLRDGAPITIRLRGQERSATAEVLEQQDEAARAAEIQAIYAPMVSAAQAARLAPEAVIVHVHLN